MKLSSDYKTFLKNRSLWITDGRVGQYVVIFRGETSFHPTLQAAAQYSADTAGRAAVFLRQITEDDLPDHSPSLLAESGEPVASA